MFRKTEKMIQRKERFSLRKFKQGLAPVTLGTVLFISSAYAPYIPYTQSAVYAASSEDYATSNVWTATNAISNNNTNPSITPSFSSAVSSVRRKDGTTVNVTATIRSTNGNAEGTSYLTNGDNQSRYGATTEMFADTIDPASIPALGVYVQPKVYTGNNLSEYRNKLNFNGEEESAILTLRFSESVTNPIIDISGLGGSASFYLDRVDNRTGRVVGIDGGRASFNATKLELITSGITLEKLKQGANLGVTSSTVSVIEKNTHNFSVLDRQFYVPDADPLFRSPNLVPAGAGSIQLNGTFTEVSFKLHHSATPYTAFSNRTHGTGAGWFTNANTLHSDGINGFDRSLRENYPDSGNSTNGDLFRLSIRLDNTTTGSVVIDYVDVNGNSIKTRVVDKAVGTAVGTSYNANEGTERPRTITVSSGSNQKEYELVPTGTYPVGQVGTDGNLTATTKNLGTASVTGNVEQGEKKITYVYREVVKKGNIVVHYEDDKGNKIKDDNVISSNTPVGEQYDSTTPTVRPNTIVKDNKTYVLTSTTPKSGSSTPTGTVEENTKNITYVYKQTGQVKAEYYIENTDTKLRTDQTVKPEGSPLDEEYTDVPPVELIGSDNKVYELVKVDNTPTLKEGSAQPTGVVTAEEQVIKYQYKLKVGNVVVHYEDDKGNKIKDDNVISSNTPVGEQYDSTTPTVRPNTIVKDNKTYVLTSTTPKSGSSTPTGTVEENTKNITYVYKQTGQVKAEYYIENTDTKLRTDQTVKPEGSPLDEEYTDVPPVELIGSDNKVYELVKVDNTPTLKEGSAQPTGVVTAEEQVIKYQYKLKVGNVVVHYEDDKGNKIKDDNVISSNTPVGEQYDSTTPTVRPNTIVKDNKTYVLTSTTPKSGSSTPTGTVEENTKNITYVYKQTGQVKAEYYIENTDTKLRTDQTVKPEGSPLDEEYTDVPPVELIGSDNKVYELVKVDNTPTLKEGSAQPTGVVTAEEQVIKYQYKLKVGNVVVHYEDDKGNKIKDDNVISSNTPVGEQYDSTTPTVRPNTIVKDNKTYVLTSTTPKSGSSTPTGTVEENTKNITYVYKQTGQVKAEYYIENTDTKLRTDQTVKPEGSPLDEEYTDVPPAELIGSDNKVYELVKVDNTPTLKEGSAQPTGVVTAEEQVIKYQYKLKVGNVVVHYKDDKGNTIKDDVEDTPTVATGTEYSTFDHKPNEIIKDGVRYVLVPDKTEGVENGQVVEGTTHITYVYTKVANWVPLIPNVPVKKETPKKVVPQKKLPQTGSENNEATLLGLGVSAIAGALFIKRRKEEK